MKEFERMQKLVFGDTIPALKNIQNPPSSLTENKFRDKIKELVYKSLDEAKKKKKKDEDVAPQEDIDIEMDTTEEMPEDTMAPESTGGADIDPTVKSIQDSLQKAFAQAKTLGDEKLIAQIGNTITMLVRTQVLDGQQGMNENIEMEPEYESADYTRGYDAGYIDGYKNGERDTKSRYFISEK